MTDINESDLLEEMEDLNNIADPVEREERKITVLETWSELLSNAQKYLERKPTMEDAVGRLGRHPWLRVEDLPAAYTEYHSILDEAFQIVQSEIGPNPYALVIDEDEEDGVKNKHHYLNILLLWQQMLTQKDAVWDVTDASAGGHLAAYIDAAAFLVGQQGIVSYLDMIEFQFDDDDRELVYGALNEEVVS